MFARAAPAKNGAPGTNATPRSTACGSSPGGVEAVGQLDHRNMPPAGRFQRTPGACGGRARRASRRAAPGTKPRGSSARAGRGTVRMTSCTTRWLKPGCAGRPPAWPCSSLPVIAGGRRRSPGAGRARAPGERAEVDHAFRMSPGQRRRRRLVEPEVAVRVVLDQRQPDPGARRTSAARRASPMVRPVGFWKLGSR